MTALSLLVTAGEAAAFLLLGTAFHLKYGSSYNIPDVSETFSHTKYKCKFGIRADRTHCQDEEQDHCCRNTFFFSPLHLIYKPHLHCHCFGSSLPHLSFAFSFAFFVRTAHHPAPVFPFYPQPPSRLDLSFFHRGKQPPLHFPLFSHFASA